MRSRYLPAVVLFAVVLAVRIAGAAAPVYDPLHVPESFKAERADFVVCEDHASRQVPVRVYLPATHESAPVVLFSHGLGGSKENNPYLGEHWAARGYVAVFLQHAGSDERVWKDVPVAGRMAAMRRAASARNLMLRVKDVGAVLDRLEAWNRDPRHTLHGRLDLSHVGMSGHSFGAVTTQAVSGQTSPFGLLGGADSRIRAAVAFSPSAPRAGDPAEAFGKVGVPWMLMTGTKDVSPIGGMDVPSRLAVFPALPPGHKYELVLDGAEHSAFGERALAGDKAPRNPNHHRAILALTSAFWDAYLKGDSAAQAWLDSDGARAVLEPADRWQRK